MKELKRVPNTTLFADEDGRIYRLRELKPWRKDKREYLCIKDEKKNLPVHRLVAKAFLPEPLPGQTEVNHKNGIPNDNRADNLEWVTPRRNAEHRGEAKKEKYLTKEDCIKLLESLPDGATISSIRYRE